MEICRDFISKVVSGIGNFGNDVFKESMNIKIVWSLRIRRKVVFKKIRWGKNKICYKIMV